LLILTVGGAPEPIAASLASSEPQPVERAIFVCSRDSRPSLGLDSTPPAFLPNRPTVFGLIGQLGRELRPSQFKFVTISDHQDLTRCVEEMRRSLDPQVRAWLNRGPGFLVIADSGLST
jgi:hypothetical protein